MSQNVRHACDNCGNSIYNTFINDVRVPYLFYLVASQPADTGPTVHPDDLPVPAPIREMLVLPTPRIELCTICAAKIFGWPIAPALTTEQKEANSTTHPKFGPQRISYALAAAAALPEGTPEAEVHRVAKADALYALEKKKSPTPAGRKAAQKAGLERQAKGIRRATRAVGSATTAKASAAGKLTSVDTAAAIPKATEIVPAPSAGSGDAGAAPGGAPAE